MELEKQVGWESIVNDRRYQVVREAKIGMILALSLYDMQGIPAFVQLVKDDPPDVRIAQFPLEDPGTINVINVEITTYSGKNQETLLEQLKRTKVPENYHKYGDEYILVIEIQTEQVIDYDEVSEYLLQNKVPFPVWALKPIQHTPSTIGEVITLTPKLKKYLVDFGKLGYSQKEKKIPPTIKTQRAGRVDKAGMVPSESKYLHPPWYGMIT